MLPKNTTFEDRQAASAAAKKALLEKFKPKPMVQAEEVIDHAAEKAARVAEVRRQREEEKLARQQAREEAEARAEEERIAAIEAAEVAKIEAQRMTDAEKRADRKARKKETKEAAKAKKEQRLATATRQTSSAPEDRAYDARREHERYIAELERRRA
jgi:hypothetical protein